MLACNATSCHACSSSFRWAARAAPMTMSACESKRSIGRRCRLASNTSSARVRPRRAAIRCRRVTTRCRRAIRSSSHACSAVRRSGGLMGGDSRQTTGDGCTAEFGEGTVAGSTAVATRAGSVASAADVSGSATDKCRPYWRLIPPGEPSSPTRRLAMGSNIGRRPARRMKHRPSSAFRNAGVMASRDPASTASPVTPTFHPRSCAMWAWLLHLRRRAKPCADRRTPSSRRGGCDARLADPLMAAHAAKRRRPMHGSSPPICRED